MTTQPGIVLQHLRGLVAAERSGQRPDRELLECFSAGEAAAFEALVCRHGPLVLGVCRRVLGDHHDAEDAFQVTFLKLARHANSVGRRGSLGCWLYRVAYHTALRLRQSRAVLLQRESGAQPRSPADPLDELTGRELLAVLDEELQQLPQRERDPLVLCYLEGKTRDEAARALGWSLRTLKRRLEQGRDRLHARLARRGLGLPALLLLAAGLGHNTSAAVPPRLLAATVKVAATPAAQGGAGTLAAGKLKVICAAVLVLGGLVAGVGLLSQPASAQRPLEPPAVRPPALPPQVKKPQPAPQKKNDRKELAVAVRVLDEDGKPVAGASLALVGVRLPRRRGEAYRDAVLATATTDGSGKHQFKVPGTSPGQFHWLHVLAAAKGHGLGYRGAFARLGDDTLKADIRLAPEQAIHGRLIDLQGQPAAKVRGRVLRVMGGEGQRRRLGARQDVLAAMMRRQNAYDFPKALSAKDWPSWPGAVVTDDQGRFTLHGFGKGQEIDLLIEDDRFATQELTFKADGKPQGLALAGPKRLEGRLLAEDTGKPIAGAWLVVSTLRPPLSALAPFPGRSNNTIVSQTDARGGFRLNPYPGETVEVEFGAPEGQPYLGVRRRLRWPKGAVRQQLDVKLPRGVVVRGKIIENPSGKAVDQAEVYYTPQVENNPTGRRDLLVGPYHKKISGPDGTFRMVLPPGNGHLIITGPRADYVSRTVGLEELRAGKAGGERRYFHGLAALKLKAKDGTKDVAITLKRGVTIKGKVVGPDGKTPANVALFCGGDLVPPRPVGVLVGFPVENGLTPVPIRDGTFELRNCDPDKTYRLYFLDAPNGRGLPSFGRPGEPIRIGINQGRLTDILSPAEGRLGAVVDLSAKRAGGKPVTVKLAPCTSARVRFVDDKGMLARPRLVLQMLVQPGPSLKKATEQQILAGEAAVLAGGDIVNRATPVRIDAKGGVTIPTLIPGATYRLKVYRGDRFDLQDEPLAEKDFTAQAGKVLDLGDVTVKQPK